MLATAYKCSDNPYTHAPHRLNTFSLTEKKKERADLARKGVVLRK